MCVFMIYGARQLPCGKEETPVLKNPAACVASAGGLVYHRAVGIAEARPKPVDFPAVSLSDPPHGNRRRRKPALLAAAVFAGSANNRTLSSKAGFWKNNGSKGILLIRSI
jgi:hypothetical protein